MDIDKLRGWKDKILGQLSGELKALVKQRKVEVVYGYGQFISANQLKVETENGVITIAFEQAIIAVGSRPIGLSNLPDDPRIIDSTGALQLNNVPDRMLVIGGGIIGLEMATVYHELGSKVSIVEMLDNIIVGTDPDIVKLLQLHIQKQYQNIF